MVVKLDDDYSDKNCNDDDCKEISGDEVIDQEEEKHEEEGIFGTDGGTKYGKVFYYCNDDGDDGDDKDEEEGLQTPKIYVICNIREQPAPDKDKGSVSYSRISHILRGFLFSNPPKPDR